MTQLLTDYSPLFATEATIDSVTCSALASELFITGLLKLARHRTSIVISQNRCTACYLQFALL